MDVHVPAAITEGLRRRSLDVLTSQDDGTREVTDEELLHRAWQLSRVLFTQDQDLLRIAHRWRLQEQEFPGVIYLRQRGASVGRCIDDLQLIAECCFADELVGQIVFLPLV